MGRPKKVIEDVEIVAASPPSIEETKTEETIPSKKIKTQKEICKILYKTDKKINIDFKGFGLQLLDSTPIDQKSNKIELLFTGEIGTKSFEIISHKFI